MAEPGYPRGETVFDRFGRAIGLGRPPERVVIQPRSPYGDTRGREVEVPNPLPPGWDARPRPAGAPPDEDPGGHQGAWDAAVDVPTRVGGARRMADNPYPESGTPGPSEQPWQGSDSPDQYFQDQQRTRDPGETGGQPVVDRTKPPPPPQTRGGRGAISTGAPDQQRTAAYDPEKEGPYAGQRQNVFAMPQAPAGRERTAGSAMADVRGGANQDMSSNNVANDMTPSIQSGTSWLHRLFHQDKRDEHTDRSYPPMLKGIGAPDMGEVHAVFATVDPKNELPMNRKMELATRAGHDWLMARAQNASTPEEKADLEQRAGRWAGEMIQFSVKMASGHGEQAVEAMKNGNIDEAVHQIQAGYGWMADGHHIDRQGNNLVMKDQNGRVTQTMPITLQDVQNIAHGMMTGEMTHDVYRSRAQASAPPPMPKGRQPWDEKIDPNASTVPIEGGTTAANQPTGRPAAQPAAAAAGPTPSAPAAPAPTQTPPAAPPAAGTPPAGEKPNQVIAPVAPSSLAPVTQGGAPAPATPPTVTPPGQTAPAAGAPVTPTGNVPARKPYDPPLGADGKPQLYRYVTDEPDQKIEITLPPLGNQPARKIETTIDDAEKNLENVFDRKRAEIMKETDALPKSEQWVRNKRLEGLNKQQAAMTAMVKEKRAEHTRAFNDAHKEEKEDTKKHPLSEDEALKVGSVFTTREQQIRADAANNPQGHFATVLPVSPLRYLTGEGQSKRIADIAEQIKTHNNSRVNAQQAYDIAVDITRHVPDEVKGPDGKTRKLTPKEVLNGHVGKQGAYFDVVAHDANKQPVLRTASGHTISLPRTVLNAVIGLKDESYEHAKEEEKKDAEQTDRDKTNVGKVLSAVVPKVPPGTEPSYGLGMGP